MCGLQHGEEKDSMATTFTEIEVFILFLKKIKSFSHHCSKMQKLFVENKD